MPRARWARALVIFGALAYGVAAVVVGFKLLDQLPPILERTEWLGYLLFAIGVFNVWRYIRMERDELSPVRRERIEAYLNWIGIPLAVGVTSFPLPILLKMSLIGLAACFILALLALSFVSVPGEVREIVRLLRSRRNVSGEP